MFVQILILILGFILLITGANYLIKGASNIAKKFNIPEILIGLTIVSLGTTLPELVVTIISAATGSTDIVLGNIIGSNLCNLLLILGIVTILKPIKFEKSTINKNLPLLIILTVLVIIMGIGFFNNNKLTITRSDSVILLLIALFYFISPVIQTIKDLKNTEKNHIPKEEGNTVPFILQNFIYIILGGLALKYGGDFAVDSATNIAQMFNISERVIGLTIVALGTSLPELITSIVAILKGDEDLAEGNIIGACTINLCLALGVGSFISNIPLTAIYIEDLILLLISSTLIWLFGFTNKDNILTRYNGIVLFLIYLIYSIKLFI